MTLKPVPIDITGMSLSQALMALQRMQTWFDQAVQDRTDFMARYGMREGATENGTLMAYYWREAGLKCLMNDMRDAICAKFIPASLSEAL